MINYWKSPEGLKAYEKLGSPYPNNISDETYEEFKKHWFDHMPKNKKPEQYIRKMVRVQDLDKKEYIIHDMCERGFDATGKNSHVFYRSPLGVYPEPKGQYKISYNQYNEQVSTLESVGNEEMCYSIPFSDKNADRLHKLCVEEPTKQVQKKTEYMVKKAKDNREISVDSYKDWLNGKFEDLIQWGHVASPEWRKQNERLKKIEEELKKKKLKQISEGQDPNQNQQTNKIYG